MEEFCLLVRFSVLRHTQITHRLIKDKHPPHLAHTNKADEGLFFTVQSTFQRLRDETTIKSETRQPQWELSLPLHHLNCTPGEPKWKNPIHVYFEISWHQGSHVDAGGCLFSQFFLLTACGKLRFRYRTSCLCVVQCISSFWGIFQNKGLI